MHIIGGIVPTETIAHLANKHGLVHVIKQDEDFVNPADLATTILITNPYKEIFEEIFECPKKPEKPRKKSGNNRKKVKRKKARNGKR